MNNYHTQLPKSNILNEIAADYLLKQDNPARDDEVAISENDLSFELSDHKPAEPKPAVKSAPPPCIEKINANIEKMTPVAETDTGSSRRMIANYVVIPIILAIIFIILVNPKISKYFDKYLPAMSTMKGYGARAAILAVSYIIIELLLALVIKN